MVNSGGGVVSHHHFHRSIQQQDFLRRVFLFVFWTIPILQHVVIQLCPFLIKRLPQCLYLKEKAHSQKLGQFVPQVPAFQLLGLHCPGHTAWSLSPCSSRYKWPFKERDTIFLDDLKALLQISYSLSGFCPALYWNLFWPRLLLSSLLRRQVISVQSFPDLRNTGPHPPILLSPPPQSPPWAPLRA